MCDFNESKQELSKIIDNFSKAGVIKRKNYRGKPTLKALTCAYFASIPTFSGIIKNVPKIEFNETHGIIWSNINIMPKLNK